MAGITLAQAEAQLADWLAASSAAAAKQSYEIAGRRLTYVNAQEIREQVKFWNSWVVNLSAASQGRSRARTIVPAR